jgi:hypothetical protein
MTEVEKKTLLSTMSLNNDRIAKCEVRFGRTPHPSRFSKA